MRCLSLTSSLLPCPSTTPPHLIPATTVYTPPYPPLKLRSIGCNSSNFRRRGVSVVTRAIPTTSTYIFAFVFPLSLLAATVFISVNVVDKLDKKFLEELAVEQALLEEDEDGNEISSAPERETVPNRIRNRPKREVESSSM